jgi:hypothetical protein
MATGRATTAQKAEAADEEKITFEFDGDEYTVDADLDISALELVQDGKDVDGMRAILGDEQWNKFRLKHRKSSQLNALYRAYNKAGLGNS